MKDNFSTIRDRIHEKSHRYFVFGNNRWDKKKRNMFYGACDALLDTQGAAASYGKSISSSADKLLICYGFLQALYVQQDAISVLSRALDIKWSPNAERRLKEIRDMRNRLTGHPALAGEREEKQSSAIIPLAYVSPTEFVGHVYYEDRFEEVRIRVAELQKDNEDRLFTQLKAIEKKMDDLERGFRKEQSKKPLSSHFATGFKYLMQRLWCNLTDDGRVIQAQSHSAMLLKIFEGLRNDLTKRGFGAEASTLKIIFKGLGLLESIMSREPRSEEDQDEFDLIYDGLEKKVELVKKTVEQLDAKINKRPA